VDKGRPKKPLPFGGESSIAVLLVLVARVSVDPKVCSQNGVANLKSLPADLHLVRRSLHKPMPELLEQLNLLPGNLPHLDSYTYNAYVCFWQ
jgi:hypothetical protein